MVAGWAMTTAMVQAGGEAPKPEWISQAMWGVGAALVVWGSYRNKVERLELEMDKRVSKDVFDETTKRIDEKLDRILAESHINTKLDRLIEGKS